MKSIFEFLDYRKFLEEFYLEKKKRNPHYSHRFLLGRAGIKNPGFFSLLIKGKRKLSERALQQLTQGLGLKGREAQYFHSLVRFNQAKTAAEKQTHYENLKSVGKFVNQRIIGQDAFEYFQFWYIPIIRELVCFFPFPDDYARLAKAIVPAISSKESKQAVAFLLKIGMLKRTASGRFVQKVKALIRGDEVSILAVANFNKEMIKLAGASLERSFPDERYIRGLTVGITQETFEKIKKELIAVNDRIIGLVDEDKNSDRVYQLNIQCFPVSVKGRPKN